MVVAETRNNRLPCFQPPGDSLVPSFYLAALGRRMADQDANSFRSATFELVYISCHLRQRTVESDGHGAAAWRYPGQRKKEKDCGRNSTGAGSLQIQFELPFPTLFRVEAGVEDRAHRPGAAGFADASLCLSSRIVSAGGDRGLSSLS